MNIFGKKLFGNTPFGKSIFGKIMAREITETLGNPLGEGSGAFMARKGALALMRGGRGFRTPASRPRVYSNGMTRGQQKRVIRAACAAAEKDRQKRVCGAMADRSGIPFDMLKFQFGAL